MEMPMAIIWSSLRVGSIVLSIAWLATSAMRRSTASARHMVWVAGLCGMALLAVLAAVPTGKWNPVLAIDVPAIKVLVSDTATSTPIVGNTQLLLAGWLVGAVALLLPLACSHIRASLLARKARGLDETYGGVQLLESPIGQGPMMWGLFHPAVFLPPDAVRWEPRVREAVLRHELAHCERRDCWWLLLARVISGVFWFQPLVWLAVRRISAECERAADDAVLLTGVSADDYANWLINIARTSRGEPAAALAIGRSSEFEGRLKAVLDPRVNRRGLSRAGAMLLAVAACLVLFPLAAAQNSGSDDKVYKMDDGISPPSLIFKVEPQYTEEARDAKLMGTVLLTVQIQRDGTPKDIQIKEGLPMGLSENAVAAVKQWKFKPGTKDGRPVNVLANIEINFRLN